MDRHILVATDDTEHSKNAVAYCIHVAILSTAELTIGVDVALGGDREPILYAHSDMDAKKLASSAAEKARLAGVKYVPEMVILSREANSSIVQYAE